MLVDNTVTVGMVDSLQFCSLIRVELAPCDCLAFLLNEVLLVHLAGWWEVVVGRGAFG